MTPHCPCCGADRFDWRNSQGALLSDDEVASAIRFWEDHATRDDLTAERLASALHDSTVARFGACPTRNQREHDAHHEVHAEAILAALATPPYRPVMGTGLPAAAGVTGAPAAADTLTAESEALLAEFSETDRNTWEWLPRYGVEGAPELRDRLAAIEAAARTTSGPPRSPVAVAGHPGAPDARLVVRTPDGASVVVAEIRRDQSRWDDAYAGTVAMAKEFSADKEEE